MRKAGTVCFIIENEKVLLARIQYPDGKFFWNGIGGVIDAEETPAQTVVREVAEETRILLEEDAIRDVLTIALPELDLHVCTACRWRGMLEIIDPSLKELRWFDFSDVPYAEMHEGNDTWLPKVLKAV